MIALQGTRLKEVSRWLPGIGISLIMIILLIRLVNMGEVIQALKLVKMSWLIPVVLLYLGGMFLRSWTWATLLQGKIPLPRVFLTLHEGYLLNNLFPFRVGEIGRAVLLNQASGLSTFFILSTILIERAYDLAIASSLLLVTLPYVVGFEAARELSVTVLAAVGILFIGLSLMASYQQVLKAKMENFWSTNILYQRRLLPRLGLFLAGLGILRSPLHFLLSLTLILASWLFGLLEVHLLAVGIGIEPSWWWTGFVLGVVSLGIALPAAPASLGVYEASMVGSFLLLDVPGEQALALAIMAHFIHIAITGIIGGYALARDGQSLTGIYARLRREINKW